MDFEEFLWSKNEKALASLIRESFTKHKTCPFHKVAMELFQEYLITGGFPEVIQAEETGKSTYEIDAIKQKIIDIYKKEIMYNKTLIDIPRGLEVVDSIPEQLKKENKKFQYGLLGQGRRAKEYESSINYLVDNQLVYRSYKIKEVKSPLSSCREKDSFKLYLPDDGMLFTMLHLNIKKFLSDEKMKETIYENRFKNVEYLNKMGANIVQSGPRKIVVAGPSTLTGKDVVATDLRAGACMLLAGLKAKGKTTISDVEHILRGYENLIEKLKGVGANIELIDN